MSRVSLGKRIRRLKQVVQPRHSIGGRVELLLSENERAIFFSWKLQMDRQHDHCKRRAINSYADCLENPNDWPRLSPAIDRKLWPEEPYQ